MSWVFKVLMNEDGVDKYDPCQVEIHSTCTNCLEARRRYPLGGLFSECHSFNFKFLHVLLWLGKECISIDSNYNNLWDENN